MDVVVIAIQVGLHLAEGPLQLLAGGDIAVLGLLHPGIHRASGIEGQVETQAHVGLAERAILVVGAGVLVVGVGGAEAGDQIQRRLMAGLGQVDLLLGNILGDALLVQAQVFVLGQLHPVFDLLGQWSRGETLGIQAVQGAMIAAGQLPQRLVTVGQLIFRDYDLGGA